MWCRVILKIKLYYWEHKKSFEYINPWNYEISQKWLGHTSMYNVEEKGQELWDVFVYCMIE